MPGAERPPVIGALQVPDAARKLDELGELDTARTLLGSNQGEVAQFVDAHWPFGRETPVYKYTAHAFGFVPMGPYQDQLVEIKNAGEICADQKLKQATVKITLDRLRVFDYPGKGEHTILFDFYARHQSKGGVQDLRFNQTYRVQPGAGAGIAGYPVFVGLRVGDEGVAFRCLTANIKNASDQKILSFLNSDVFKNGLELINTINPLAPILTQFATGITEGFANRNRNVPVQDFFLGLDFSGIPTRAQLCEGSYIAVQTPSMVWDWSKWRFMPSVGQVVSTQNPQETIPYNYIIFSISKMRKRNMNRNLATESS